MVLWKDIKKLVWERGHHGKHVLERTCASEASAKFSVYPKYFSLEAIKTMHTVNFINMPNKVFWKFY